MNNRFLGIKTLGDLYLVFSNEDVSDYSSLTEAELDRVADVFEANIPDKVDMPDRPLTEAGYTLIWNVTVDTVESFIAKETKALEEETEVTYNNVNMEEKVMGIKDNVQAAVEDMMSKFAQAKDNIKVQAGETKEEYIDRVDDSLNVMKGAFGKTLGVLDGILGYSILKNSILDMIESSTDGKTSKKDLFKMAKRCRELIEKEIENLEFWGDEESFKKAVQLKALTEDERGKSIFESFVSGVIWIGKKVSRKLHKWFQVDEEKSIIGAICRSIAGLAGVLRAGVKIVWNAVKFAASFIVSGVILIVDAIVRAVKSVVSKIKGWATKRAEIIEDEDFDDEFDEEIVEAELA